MAITWVIAAVIALCLFICLTFNVTSTGSPERLTDLGDWGAWAKKQMHTFSLHDYPELITKHVFAAVLCAFYYVFHFIKFLRTVVLRSSNLTPRKSYSFIHYTQQPRYHQSTRNTNLSSFTTSSLTTDDDNLILIDAGNYFLQVRKTIWHITIIKTLTGRLLK